LRSRKETVRRFLVLLSLAALPLTVAAAAAADPPDRTIITVNQTALAVGMTRRCGFPIYRADIGTFKVMDFYDESGTLLKTVLRNFGPYTIKSSTLKGTWCTSPA
jgi:hypothetical protein